MNGKESKGHHNRPPAEASGRLLEIVRVGIDFHHIMEWISGYDRSPRIPVNHIFVKKLRICESCEGGCRKLLICADRECPCPLPD